MQTTFCLSCGGLNRYEIRKPEKCSKCGESFNSSLNIKTSNKPNIINENKASNNNKTVYITPMSDDEIYKCFLSEGTNEGVKIREVIKNNGKQ